MSRSSQVTKDILSDCRSGGEGRAAGVPQHLEGAVLHCLTVLPVHVSARAGNNVLIVAHASSLEACTRQLQRRRPLTPRDFVQAVRKVRKHQAAAVTALFS